MPLRTASLLLAGALLAGGCRITTLPPRSQDHRQQDSTEVAAAASAFLQAFDSLDWPAFASHLSDSVDAFWPRPDTAQRLRDRAAVEDHFQAFFERIRRTRPGPPYLHLKPADLSVRLFDDVAIVTFELADVPDTIGRRTLVFHHDPAGWRIVHLHASNLPLGRRAATPMPPPVH